MSWSSRVALLALALTAVFALPGLARAANPSADIDQCANGSLAAPNAPACDPNEWVNGNLGSSKAHYVEGDTVPYRLKFDNLSLSGSHKVLIEWDTTKSGKHALDYLRTYNETVTTANPCAGVLPCGSPSTFPIPPDTQVTGAPVTQLGGVFTLYGGTITSVSPYTYNPAGFLAADTSASVTITFTASVANPVLAWGGHIATRADWGPTMAATSISGSPYHMRLLDLDGAGGNQDRSLSADAVIFPASITIVKDAVPNDAQVFSFTATPALAPLANFTLFDDGNAANNTKTFSGITSFQAYTITEAAVANWSLSLSNPVCTVVTPNGGSFSGNAGTRSVTITVAEGESVTCKFTNTLTKLTPTVATAIHNTAHATITSAAIGSVVHDSATVTGSSTQPTGTVSFTVYSGVTDCSGQGAPVGSGSLASGSFDNTAGTSTVPAGGLSYKAHYEGNALYVAADGPCEALPATKLTPTVTTAIHNVDHVTITSASIGATVHDSASVTGAAGAGTGTVSFNVYLGVTDCSGQGTAVGSGSLTSGSFDNTAGTSPVPAGGLSYKAHYEGSTTYNAADGPCEPLAANKLTPTVTTAIHNTDHGTILSAPIGATVHDSASVTGAAGAGTGTVSFTVYLGVTNCSGPGAAAGSGSLASGSFDNTTNTSVVPVGGLSYKAHYAGSTTYNAGDGPCEALEATKLTPTVTTAIHNTDHGTILSAPIGATVHDSASVTGAAGAGTGTVSFTVYLGVTNCSGDGAAAGSGPLDSGSFDNTENTSVVPVGGLSYKAHYAGSDTYLAGDGPCEALEASKLTPTVTTAIHNADHGTIVSAPFGSLVHDSASVTGAAGAGTGTVSFTVYLGVTNCSGEGAAAGSGSLDSGSFDNTENTSTVPVGGLSYKAHYAGDSKYLAGDGPCEALDMTKLDSSVHTDVHKADHGVITSAPIGSTVHDNAQASGTQAGGTPTGDVVFRLYSQASCDSEGGFTSSEPVALEGGIAESGPTDVAAGGLAYMAHYLGSAIYNDSFGDCEPLEATKLTPTLSTNASAPVVVGGQVKDVAHLSGGLDPQGSIEFKLYASNDSECSGTPVFTDSVGVDGANDYTSSGFTTVASGTYYWSAEFIPSEIDHNNNGVKECGGENESVSVTHPAISIVKNPKTQSITTGGTANFTITVTNTGDVALSGVQVTDTLAPNCAKTIGDLAAGATTSYDCALAGVAASFTNSATATGHPAVGLDVTATDTAPVTVNSIPPPPPPPPPPPVIPTPPAPKIDLQITKADSPDPDVLGTQVRYLITVKNNGPDTAHNVQMSDPLPFQVTFSSVSTTQGTCTGGQLVSCQLGTIANGASVTVTVFVKTNETGLVTNTATTVGTEAETNTANNTATTTTLVKGPFTPPVVPTGCYAVAVSPHGLTAGKRSTLVLSVHMLGKPAKNARVKVTGAGISKTSGPTNAKGIVRMSVKPAKPGILKFQPVAHKGCALPRIGVIGAFTPPVTG